MENASQVAQCQIRMGYSIWFTLAINCPRAVKSYEWHNSRTVNINKLLSSIYFHLLSAFPWNVSFHCRCGKYIPHFHLWSKFRPQSLANWSVAIRRTRDLHLNCFWLCPRPTATEFFTGHQVYLHWRPAGL